MGRKVVSSVHAGNAVPTSDATRWNISSKVLVGGHENAPAGRLRLFFLPFFSLRRSAASELCSPFMTVTLQPIDVNVLLLLVSRPAAFGFFPSFFFPRLCATVSQLWSPFITAVTLQPMLITFCYSWCCTSAVRHVSAFLFPRLSCVAALEPVHTAITQPIC